MYLIQHFREHEKSKDEAIERSDRRLSARPFWSSVFQACEDRHDSNPGSSKPTSPSSDKQDIHSADDLRKLLSSSIKNQESAEVALLHIMEEHRFSLSLLQQILFGSFVFFSLWKRIGSSLLLRRPHRRQLF